MNPVGPGAGSAEPNLPTEPASPASPRERTEALALLSTVFLVASCGLVYELLLSTVSSYLVGSSVTQFSLCIGTFVGAMGLGSWLSQFVSRGLLRWFLGVELTLALAGGFSAWALVASYAFLGAGYWVVLFGTLTLLGALVGIELPLLTRLLSNYGSLRSTIANALSFDYVGALVGSVAFPLALLPWLGTSRTAFVIGMVNLAAVGINVWVFRHRLRSTAGPWAVLAGLAAVLGTGLAVADRATHYFEQRLYDDQVLMARQTRYQRIVITRNRNDLRLYLDGNLQFSSVDEYRYHEALVHPAMAMAPSRREVLVLGGGDGLGIREVLRWPDVGRVTLVDIDPEMTKLGKSFPALRRQNAGAFDDPRVRVVHRDAFAFLQEDTTFYDVVLGDLPDPNNESVARLYTQSFFTMVRQRLARGGIFATQATSPLFSRDAFWCVARTVEASGMRATPYHAYVPSFGEWGWVIARVGSRPPVPSLADLPPSIPLRWGSVDALSAALRFPKDMERIDGPVCRLDRLEILGLYEQGIRDWELD